MALNVKSLAAAMLGAAQGKLQEHWPEVREYAETETRKTADTLASIERLLLAGQINSKQAKALLRMQRNSAQSVLLTIEGLGLLTVESAINAALGAVRDTVNGAVGFALL